MNTAYPFLTVYPFGGIVPEFVIQDVEGNAVGKVYLHDERLLDLIIAKDPEQWVITPQVVRYYQGDPKEQLRSFLLQPIPAQERRPNVNS